MYPPRLREAAGEAGACLNDIGIRVTTIGSSLDGVHKVGSLGQLATGGWLRGPAGVLRALGPHGPLAGLEGAVSDLRSSGASLCQCGEEISR